MTQKILAYTNDGKLTYCSALPEERGKGRCNHIAHINIGEDPQAFMERVVKEFNKNKQTVEYLTMSREEKLESIARGEGIDILRNDTDKEIKRAIKDYDFDVEEKLISDFIDKDELSKEEIELLKKHRYFIDLCERGIYIKNPESINWMCKNLSDQELDKLLFDKNGNLNISDVTSICTLIENGKYLDKFINDKNSYYRAEVAKQGYGLDKLINDESPYVRHAVKDFINNTTSKNNTSNINKISSSKEILDKYLNDEDPWNRVKAAEQGYGLDKLVNDEFWKVRQTVAKQGYGLDKLINDEDDLVRAAVAEQGYGLEKLVNDKNKFVLEKVKKHGYGLDKIKKYREIYVRDYTVHDWLGEHNMSLRTYKKILKDNNGDYSVFMKM